MSQAAVKIGSTGNQQQATTYKILIILGLCHLLNDTLQSVVPAMFPILEKSMGLSYTQLGMIAFSLNIVASLLQPVIGMYSDKKPKPYTLPLALTFTLVGVTGLTLATNLEFIMISVACMGIGSAMFHPEGSKVAFWASGPRRGLGQSIYQVGGNTGQSLAPLITAAVLVPLGQRGAGWFILVAALAVGLLYYISRWYSAKLLAEKLNDNQKKGSVKPLNQPYPKIAWVGLGLVLFLIFARSWYVSGMTNYYAFFAIDHYGLSIRASQTYTFVFLLAGAVGTFFGGPLADRFGKKNVIFASLIGSAPFTLLLPFVNSGFAIFFLAISGFILMTSFSVTVVYAQELFPGKIGTMAGLTVGLAFGMGAIGSVGLGFLADHIGITKTMIIVGLLPLLGIFTSFLPTDKKLREIYSDK
ncbi:MFS transporter [Bacillus sp. DNRA2]|nr:MFS transporter [Bacillus sp. DNRA2]NMD72786.1 MFS transporter [Bacillus sp. DNRA2]